MNLQPPTSIGLIPLNKRPEDNIEVSTQSFSDGDPIKARFLELLHWIRRNKLDLPHPLVSVIPGISDKTLKEHGIDFLLRFGNGVKLGVRVVKSLRAIGRAQRHPEQSLDGIKIVPIEFDYLDAIKKMSHAAKSVIEQIVRPLVRVGRKIIARAHAYDRKPRRRKDRVMSRSPLNWACREACVI
jgi:hypothetical protein